MTEQGNPLGVNCVRNRQVKVPGCRQELDSGAEGSLPGWSACDDPGSHFTHLDRRTYRQMSPMTSGPVHVAPGTGGKREEKKKPEKQEFQTIKPWNRN